MVPVDVRDLIERLDQEFKASEVENVLLLYDVQYSREIEEQRQVLDRWDTSTSFKLIFCGNSEDTTHNDRLQMLLSYAYYTEMPL